MDLGGILFLLVIIIVLSCHGGKMNRNIMEQEDNMNSLILKNSERLSCGNENKVIFKTNSMYRKCCLKVVCLISV